MQNAETLFFLTREILFFRLAFLGLLDFPLF